MVVKGSKDKKKQELQRPIHPLLQKRWSPRAFSDELLSKEQIQTLFEAARWAPSSYNDQPWFFLYATRDNEAQHKKLLSCLNEGNRSWAQKAPLLVVAIARPYFSRNSKPNRHAWHDVGQAIAHLTIQATAMDLYVHQMAGFSPEKTIEIYNIPDEYEPVTTFVVGRLGDPENLEDEGKRTSETKPQQRKPQEEFVFEGAWRP